MLGCAPDAAHWMSDVSVEPFSPIPTMSATQPTDEGAPPNARRQRPDPRPQSAVGRHRRSWAPPATISTLRDEVSSTIGIDDRQSVEALESWTWSDFHHRLVDLADAGRCLDGVGLPVIVAFSSIGVRGGAARRASELDVGAAERFKDATRLGDQLEPERSRSKASPTRSHATACGPSTRLGDTAMRSLSGPRPVERFGVDQSTTRSRGARCDTFGVAAAAGRQAPSSVRPPAEPLGTVLDPCSYSVAATLSGVACLCQRDSSRAERISALSAFRPSCPPSARPARAVGV
jgi:hypothetical protein